MGQNVVQWQDNTFPAYQPIMFYLKGENFGFK